MGNWKPLLLHFLSFSTYFFHFLPISQILMAIFENARHCIPNYLYSVSPKKSLILEEMASPPSANGAESKRFVVPAPSEPAKIEMFSPAFYAASAFSGGLSTGLTHTAVTPFDLVKCNMQVWFPYIPFCFLAMLSSIRHCHQSYRKFRCFLSVKRVLFHFVFVESVSVQSKLVLK